MPNTAITSTASVISLVFNDDNSITGYDKGTYRIDHIVEVELRSDHVLLVLAVTHRLQLSYSANTKNYLLVDTVNAVAPTSLSDLYDKIVALID